MYLRKRFNLLSWDYGVEKIIKTKKTYINIKNAKNKELK